MAGAAFEDGEVVARMARFTPILVDGDEHKPFARHLGVAGFPTVVFCDAEGKKKHQVVGAVPTDHFRREVDRAIKLVFGN